MKCKKYFRFEQELDRYGNPYRQAVYPGAEGGILCGGRIRIRIEPDKYEQDRIDFNYYCEKCKCKVYEPGMPYSEYELEGYLQTILDNNETWLNLIT